jgi:1-acyl-sn-glycerol-3-phosphate acyltransferase
MLSALPETLRGVLSVTLVVANLVFWIIPFYCLTLLKLLPVPALRGLCFRGLEAIAALWIDGNNAIARLHDITFDVRGTETLEFDRWYLIASNHQSWVDVFALQHAFNRKIPFLRFFLKRELIWIPLLGLAWWALELPFMKRHTREELEADPTLRQRDLETTRRSCEPFRRRPTAIINFLEGTRFTPAKHAAQASPYRHLLRPKIGGIAFALAAIGDVMDTFLDVTLVYSKEGATFWDLMCGRIRRVIVDVQCFAIPAHLRDGDYTGDPHYRAQFKAWVETRWAAKDARIGQLQSEL